MNKHSQNSWVIKLPWAEFVLCFNGKVVQDHCKLCSLIDGKYKFLIANLDSLWKHVSRCKVLVTMSRVKVGEHYFLKSNAHVANEKLYFAKGSKIVVQQVTHGVVQFFDKRKKIVQFALIFHLFNHDHPMIKYITM